MYSSLNKDEAVVLIDVFIFIKYRFLFRDAKLGETPLFCPLPWLQAIYHHVILLTPSEAIVMSIPSVNKILLTVGKGE